MTSKETRPPLDTNISLKDFKEFYWLKKELTSFCKRNKLGTTGSKLELAELIEFFLTYGTSPKNQKTKLKPESKFDWNKESLTRSTIITDNHKNSENVRAFFTKEIGPSFKFNVKFMNWMKSNTGESLETAINKYLEINAASKSNKTLKNIAPQFEYNTYLRDFLAANPGKPRSHGIQLWKIKKSMRGPNKNIPTDLDLIRKD